MWDQLLVFLYIFHNVGVAQSGYPPMGDEVQAGSVLLPASRRGRYLANIVRRQAVDGTGIKFNKDADRMNAEAKKKVDVLSEELLPYIIAEQERRTTLYKRVMTAIQNGEKGVTIAEIRNKPPAIIRKGLMYRCPSNRAPREPDGSGVIMCEDGVEPTPIMFESCLSAEDKELYVAENKYFFCNRHKIEGPDLPRNGTTVIGCAPCERTSLNYTSQRCALEDTDDVVVHYRYYPDRTYKFVSELDPEREVCEHWNPCQVGYIFSLPGPDQATPASELWHDYAGDTDEEISREEIAPPVPEDDKHETVFLETNYMTSPRRTRIPSGYRYDGIGFYQPNGTRTRISQANEGGRGIRGPKRGRRTSFMRSLDVIYRVLDDYVYIILVFTPLQKINLGTYYVRFESIDNKARKHVPLITIGVGETKVQPIRKYALPAQQMNTTSINYTCAQCALRGIMIRTIEGGVRNCEPDKYHLRKLDERQTVVDFEFGVVTPRDFGDYFFIMQNDDGSEERIKALSFNAPFADLYDNIILERVNMSVKLGAPVDVSVFFIYEVRGTVFVDMTCRGQSMLAAGRAGYITTRTDKTSSGRITLNIPSFENSDACDYIAEFRIDDYQHYRKSIAIIENDSPLVKLLDGEPKRVNSSEEGAPFEHTVRYQCAGCTIANVTVNGFPLETTTRRSGVGSVAYYLPGQQSVTIGITEFYELYGGMYQAIFQFGDLYVTKNLMEIVLPDDSWPPDMDRRRSGGSDNKDEGESTVDQQQPAVNTEDQQPGAKDETVGADGNDKTSSPDQQKNLTTSEMRQSLADAEKLLSVETARDAAAAGAPYKRAVPFTAPGGTLAAVSCRGRDFNVGWRVIDNTANIEFDRFADSNACVYVGVFKVGDTEYRKTLAVIENNSPMVNVSMRAVAAPAATLDQTVVYTCSLAHCDPEMIYINNRTLKSDDKEHFYSYKAEVVTGPAGNVTTVSVHLSIAPFTKEFEGMYQVVVRNGAETITKNILEVGSMT